MESNVHWLISANTQVIMVTDNPRLERKVIQDVSAFQFPKNQFLFTNSQTPIKKTVKSASPVRRLKQVKTAGPSLVT